MGRRLRSFVVFGQVVIDIHFRLAQIQLLGQPRVHSRVKIRCIHERSVLLTVVAALAVGFVGFAGSVARFVAVTDVEDLLSGFRVFLAIRLHKRHRQEPQTGLPLPDAALARHFGPFLRPRLARVRVFFRRMGTGPASLLSRLARLALRLFLRFFEWRHAQVFLWLIRSNCLGNM